MISFIALSTKVFGQSGRSVYVTEINGYVDFANENINGLLLIHRLFDSQNRDVLSSLGQEISKIAILDNESLPKNIFEDPELRFFEVSPNTLYKHIKSSRKLPEDYLGELDFIVDEMHYITNEINDLRFQMEAIIAEDLDVIGNKAAVFAEFKVIENLFFSYMKNHLSLANIIETMIIELKLESNLRDFDKFNLFADEIYFNNRDLIFSFYNKDLANLDFFVLKNQKFQSDIENLELYLPKLSNMNKIRDKTKILKRQISDINDKTTAFYSYNYEENREFLVYEPFYVYYNFLLLPSFNKYGNGIASELNKVIDHYKIPIVKYLELPHYFKTILPDPKGD